MTDSQYVQYGCGMSAASGWRNFDSSPTLRFERLPFIGGMYTKNQTRFPSNAEFGDIVRGLPVSPEYCKAVYCSHVLEHLSLEEFRVALINTFSMLRKGGVFRFVVPDLEFSINRYMTNQSPEAASIFLRETLLGRECRRKGLVGFLLDWMGNSYHLWMWDYRSLERELMIAGFVNIRQAKFGDYVNEKFELVESSSRWVNCLGVECSKK